MDCSLNLNKMKNKIYQQKQIKIFKIDNLIKNKFNFKIYFLYF